MMTAFSVLPSPFVYTLPNGLTLLLESQKSGTVAAGYFVSTGAVTETRAQMGISHFLEHLMFKGNEQMDARVLSAKLDALGGENNAYTGEEATVYYAASLSESLPELLETLTSLMRPALRDADIETERGVILEEIAMYAEEPSVRLSEWLRRQAWTGGLGQSILGTPETVTALSASDLREYWRQSYGAERVTLVVAGQFDPAWVVEWAHRELAQWQRISDEPVPTICEAIRETGIQRVSVPEWQRVQFAFLSDGLAAGHPLCDAATLLAELVGGDCGAMYWQLIDNGLCDSVDFYHVDMKGMGYFEGGFSCDPERFSHVLGIYEEILTNAADLITPEAVQRVAKREAVGCVLAEQTPQGRVFALGNDYLMTGKVRSLAERTERWLSVTPDQVRAALELCQPRVTCGVAMGQLSIS